LLSHFPQTSLEIKCKDCGSQHSKIHPYILNGLDEGQGVLLYINIEGVKHEEEAEEEEEIRKSALVMESQVM